MHSSKSIVTWIPVPLHVAQHISGKAMPQPHISMLYHGSVDSLDDSIVETLKSIIQRVAYVSTPFPVEFTSVARFYSKTYVWRNPIVAIASSADLGHLRQDLRDLVGNEGIYYYEDYSYVPHMTLTYVRNTDNYVIGPMRAKEFTATDIILKVGDDTHKYPLGRNHNK